MPLIFFLIYYKGIGIENEFFYFKFKKPIDINNIYTINVTMNNLSIGFNLKDNFLDITNIECEPIDCNDGGTQYIISILDIDKINNNIDEVLIHLNFENLEFKFTNKKD